MWRNSTSLTFDPALLHVRSTDVLKMSSGSGELVLRSDAGAVVASSQQKPVKKKPPKKPMEEEQFTEVS